MILAAIILLPMILAIMMLIASATLDGEEHPALKVALFLLSIIPFFASMHFGMLSVVKFYDFPELQNAIGDTTYWVGIMFFILITYFIIYLFYKAVHSAAQKREEQHMRY